MNALFIGYGNELREDDGFGVFVARSLKTRGVCVQTQQLTPELAQMIARFDRVIFIDANAATDAGVFAVPLPSADSVLAHSLTPWSLMNMSRELYGTTAEYLIFSVGGGSFGYGEKLTPPLKKAALELIAYLETI
ncbi:MAG: hydrogenase maturation protease [Helicobacteraceae bacterium]|jgi:hydrogenase maturation protease|nr:hydrogenase maturation protease [Helicobacteraceae bacterium]